MDEQNILVRENPTRWYRLLLIYGIILAAFNLRPAITSVGPLLGVIRDDLGLSNWTVGLLTSLPLIAFAIMSPMIPKLGRRFTNEYALMIGLILLVFGIAVRSIPFVSLLFAGTLFVGLGVSFCNVLLPSIIKEKFPLKVALMTSMYSTIMTTIAAIASGLSIPLSKGLNLGWNVTLFVWAFPAIIAIMLWFYLARKNKTEPEDKVRTNHSGEAKSNIWRSPLAWQVALYMGFQSSFFYITISWLPEILYDYGVDMATAGWMLSIAQFIGVPVSFFVPMIADKFTSQRGIVLGLGAFAISGYCGLLFGSSYTVMVISIILIGVPLGGSFALALTFLSMRARTGKQAAELSGMAQSFGYVLAAIGPISIGYLFDITHVWTTPLIALIVISALVVIFGIGAGKDKYVFD